MSTTNTITAEIRIKRCYGCGALLQDEDPNMSGYVPTEKLQSEDDCLCERCYKLRHYNQYKSTGDFSVDYVTILNSAKKEGALIVYVLNAFSLESSILTGVNISQTDNCIAVINKRDILDKNYSDDYLLKHTERLLRDKNILVRKTIITKSSLSNSNVDELFDIICKERNNKNVYFIGASQTGKSSLINCFLNKYVNKTKKLITTSPYPGTTLDVISIPLDDKTYIYDTPGIIPNSSILSYVEKDKARYVMPRNTIKAETFTAKENQSILLSNFARIDFVSGDKTNLTFLKSNDITLSRCKMDKANQLFNDICANEKITIKTTMTKEIGEYKSVELIAKNNGINKLIISGLVEMEFIGKGQKFNVYVPKNVDVFLDDTVENL